MKIKAAYTQPFFFVGNRYKIPRVVTGMFFNGTII